MILEGLTNRIVPRLFVAFLLLSLLPLLVLSWLHFRTLESSLQEAALGKLASIADKKAHQINAYIDERLTHGQILSRIGLTHATLEAARSGDGKEVRTIFVRNSLINLHEFFPTLIEGKDFYDLGLIDLAGNLIFSIRRESDLGTNLNTGPYRGGTLAQAQREALARLETRITPALPYAPSGGRPAIFIVTPVIDHHGQPLGSVFLQLDLPNFTRVADDRTGLGETGKTALAQRQNDQALYLSPIHNAHNAPNAPAHHFVPIDKTPTPMRAALDGQHGGGITYNQAGIQVFAAWRHLPALDWGMVVTIDAEEALAPLPALRNYGLLVLLAILLLAAMASLLMGRALVMPIRRLLATTERMANGDLRERAPIIGYSEYRELADSFNRMADRLAEEQAVLENRVQERTAALAKSEALLKQAQAVAKISSWHLDLIQNRLTWSDETYRMFGTPIGESLTYEGFLAHVHPDDRQAVDDAWQSALQGAPYDFTHRIVVRDETRWVREMAKFSLAADGTLESATGTVQDITDLKQTQIDLAEALHIAETANRAKSQFLANISHEIRTPMNAILGLTQLALDTPLTAEQSDLLKSVLTSGQLLLGVLNDILDYSKIEAGRLEIERTRFDIRQVLREVDLLFSAQASGKGLELRFDIPPDLPPGVEGDPLRLRQVLTNLVSNAIKFTDHGQIRVELASLPPDAGQTPDLLSLRFTVRDTGIGLDEEIIPRLFQPFTQADSSITRRYGGTGLGLAICRRLVALMGGEISASGNPGHGASFSFTIKVGQDLHHQRPGITNPMPPPRHFDGAHALVVEDKPFNQQVADVQAIASLLQRLRPYLENHELLPDELLQELATLVSSDLPGRPFAALLHQIDNFDHHGAQATLAQIAARFDINLGP